MLRTNYVRRAGRLLGAVTVTGVLSAGLLFSSPLAAQACSNDDQAIVLNYANGIKSLQGFDPVRQFDWANGI